MSAPIDLPPESDPSTPTLSPTTPFAIADFTRYWFARVLGLIAGQIQVVATGWQMYELTHSVMDLGWVGFAQFLPGVLLVMVVGQVADHFDRRMIAFITTFIDVLGLLVFAIGSWQGWLSREWIFVLAFVSGCTRAFKFPALSALLPGLVGPALLPKAIALSSSASESGFIVGPALGGFLYMAGADVTYFIAALLCAISAILFALMRPVKRKAATQPVSLQTLFAGIHFIRSKPIVLGAISLDLFAVLLGGAVAMLPVFAKDILHVGPWGLGLLRSAQSVGALSMALYLARHPFGVGVGKIMFRSVAVFGMATVVFALSHVWWLSFLALFVLGASDNISVVIRSSLVQLETPDDMRGRVSAVNALFIGTSNQLGEFESGLTAALFGLVPSVVLGGVGTILVVALWMKFFPELVKLEKLEGKGH